MSWDDGKHAKVNRVQLTFDDVIRSIEVEYEGTNLKSQRRGTVGTSSDGFTLSTDEYITNLSGYYKTTFLGDVITGLTFKTNKKTYGLYGNKTQSYFSADAPSGNQIAGFLGTSGNALSSIDVHFAPIPAPGSIKPQPVDTGNNSSSNTGGGSSKPVDTGNNSSSNTGGGSSKPVDTGNNSSSNTGGGSSNPGDSGKDGPGKKGPFGGEKGEEFNDVGFQGVKKVTVAADKMSITYIKIEYVKDGNVVILEHGSNRGELKEFTVDYPKDSITAVGGSYKHNYNSDTTLITSLYLTTSKGFTSPLFGETKGKDFVLKGDNGGKLLGFHGRCGNAIDAIGAYFDTSSQGGEGGNPSSKPDVPTTDTGAGSNNGSGSSPQKLDAQGGKGGNQWDDGGDHDGVTKIHVAEARGAVQEIRFDYVKNGQTKEGPAHGVKGARAFIRTIEISHPNEYLLSVKGWSDASNKVMGLQFITNTKISEYCGSEKLPEDEGTTDISLEVKDKKIVGFHGFADTYLKSLGAYFAPIASTPLKPSKKLKAVGADEGASWDDGAFDGVKKIHVGQNNDGIGYVAIEYENGSQKVLSDGHGKQSELGVETFELTPGEYLTSVKVYYDKLQIEGRGVTVVSCLMFKTNKQDYSQFGMSGGEAAELKEEGQKIVGFHGRASDWIHQIGVYVAPITN